MAGHYALLGQSGCGKTTLRNIHFRPDSPLARQLLFNGRN